ncbi:9260_t:CDS:1 [Funneliformis mosseae]|uniref:9260_t:CDS:1 n=1 Tax=Funneliformis mosseae TaxID=27381 RepID=A0A9N8V7B1_FUNMO|nr:9260_t:CDS:1 [Funneliformis mosseae]
MVDPPIRFKPGDDTQGFSVTNGPTKDEPCAGNAQGPVKAEFKAGEIIPIKWKITAAHRGTCTVQLSTTGKDTDFKDIKKLDKCADENGDFSEKVTLPNVNCERCTLRFRWDAEVTKELYINCADIKIGKGNDKRNVKGIPSISRGGRVINLDEI